MESLEHRSAADEVRAERARAEEYKALLAQRDTELESSRARLLAAESKLVETARAIYSATKHAARQADTLRTERDELQRSLANVRAELDAANLSLAAMTGAVAAREGRDDQRPGEARAAVAQKEVAALRAELETAREALAAREAAERELAQARSREQQLVEDLKDAEEQIAALTHLAAEVRHVARDAEQRAKLVGRPSADEEGLRAEMRSLRAELAELEEREARAHARAAETQAVADALGRERAALRAEAGALRAKVELLALAEARVRELTEAVDDLRRENDWMEQELARFGLARKRARMPLSR